MRKLLIFSILLYATLLSGQTANDDCDALCRERRRLEAIKLEYEKAMRDVEYQMLALTKKQDESVKVAFEQASADFQKAVAEINYKKALEFARIEKANADAIALLSAKFKSKWEFTTFRESSERCIDKCILPSK
jgi:hypothetical protein